MELGALLQGEGLVSVQEAEAVTTGSLLRLAVSTGPVLVAAVEVRVEARESVGAGEVINPLACTDHHQPGHQSSQQRYQAENKQTTS